MSLVSLVHTTETNIPRLKGAIAKSLNLLEFDYNRNIRSVVIKPNLCYYHDPSSGRTTDPRFIEALVELLRDHISDDIRVTIVESDASAMRCKYSFKILGYERLSNDKKLNLLNLTEDEVDEVEVGTNGTASRFNVPRSISNADLFINVPKIRLHGLAKISCCLKNVYGCNPFPKKFKYHSSLDKTIVNLNKLLKTDLCVVDGVFVNGMSTAKLGLVMAGRDPVAVDTVVSTIAGINPMKVNHISLAAREGIGTMNYELRGDDLNLFRRAFPRQTAKNRIGSYFYSKIAGTIYHSYFHI